MSREEIIAMAREAGYQYPDARGTCEDFAYFDIERFAALVTAKEREARQAAQRENELLKAKLAASGVELRRAVLAEREACAKVCSELADMAATKDSAAYWMRMDCAAAIRARGPLYDPNDVAFSKITPEARARTEASKEATL